MGGVAAGALALALWWGLAWGALAPGAWLLLGLLPVGIALVAGMQGGKGGGPTLPLDALAHASGLGPVHPGCKTVLALGALVLCVASPSPLPPLLAAAGFGLILVGWGRVPLGRLLQLLALPASFIALSSLVLIFDFGQNPVGLLDIPLAGGFISATAPGRAQALLLGARALGGVSCLYFLSLTTPLQQLITGLRKLRCPAVLIELMLLIYRFLFLLLEGYRRRMTAADARLGFESPKRWSATVGAVAGGLLAHSFGRASRCYDAMEARCYEGKLLFLEEERPLRLAHCLAAAGYLAGLGLLVFLVGRWPL